MAAVSVLVLDGTLGPASCLADRSIFHPLIDGGATPIFPVSDDLGAREA